MGLFGGDKKETTVQTTSTTQDMRTAIEGNVSTLISPGSAVGTPGSGAIVASPGSTVSQQITTSGVAADDVKGMFDVLVADRAAERTAINTLGQSLAAGLTAQSEQLGQIVAGVKTPDANMLTQLLPVVILALLIWAFLR